MEGKGEKGRGRVVDQGEWDKGAKTGVMGLR